MERAAQSVDEPVEPAPDAPARDDGFDRRAILANIFWLFADKAVRMGVGVVVGVWVARHLGPARFGDLSFAIALVALFGAGASLGLDGVVVRELVRRPDLEDELLGSALALKLAGGCAALAAAVATVRLLRPEDGQAQALVAIVGAGLVFQSLDALDFYFQSHTRSKFTVYARNAAFLAVSAAKVVLILRGAGLVAFAWTALAEVALGAGGLAVAFTAVRRAGWHIRPRRATMARLLAESWPLLVSGLAIMVYMRLDQVMLAQMAGERQIGFYSAALRLSEVWYVVPLALVSSVAPALTRARERSHAQYLHALRRLFRLLAGAAYLVAIPMTLASPLVVTWLYGAPYAPAGPILAVHVWTALFVFLGVGLSPWIVNEGLTRLQLYQTLVGAGVNVVLNVFLIPRYGGLGAAFATLLSQACSVYLSLAVLPPTRQMFRTLTDAMMLRRP